MPTLPDIYSLPSPCFVVDEALLERNVRILDTVQKRTGAKILLALKGYATFSTFPVLNTVLHGTCASSPHEARLGREEFGGEVHTYAAGFDETDIAELITITDHISFNSFAQLRRFRSTIQGAERDIRIGLRVNPEHSEGTVPIYDPCSSGSRLGIRRAHFDPDDLDGVSGLHFHTLCEQNSDALERTLDVFMERFGEFMPHMDWLNMGGGHHITREDYDIDRLCRCIDTVRNTYDVDVYLEPGEAVALNAGYIVGTVLDVIQADMPMAILDASAACHMPDVLEMPYRPTIIDSGERGEKPHSYRLAGKSCLAGDVIGEYSFDRPLKAGDRLVFTDMAIYSMVKTNTFNGLKLPAIARCNTETGMLEVVRQFGYQDFRNRLS